MKDPITYNRSDGMLVCRTCLYKLALSGGANSIMRLMSGEAVIINKRVVFMALYGLLLLKNFYLYIVEKD